MNRIWIYSGLLQAIALEGELLASLISSAPQASIKIALYVRTRVHAHRRLASPHRLAS